MKRNYIATLQQTGSFTSVTVKGGRKRGNTDEKKVKQGGNVVTYFCTPEREVIHFVVGPVSGTTLSSAADWAADAYATIAQIEDRGARAEKLAKQHEKLLESMKQQIGSNPKFEKISGGLAEMKNPTSQQIEQLFKSQFDSPWHFVLGHTSVPPSLLLSKLPLVPLATIEKPVFEYLGGQLGLFGGRSERSDELLRRAKEGLAKKRPLLLVVVVPADRRRHDWLTVSKIIQKPDVARYAKRFGVIHLRERELIALFDDLDLEPPPALARRHGTSQLAAAIIAADGKQSYGFKTADNIELRTVMRRVLAGMQRPASSSSTVVVNAEVAAERKLQLARKLVGKNPAAARKRFQSIARQYPGTKAAAAAEELLAIK